MASRSMPTGARLVASIAALFSCIAMVYVVIAYLPDQNLERRETPLLWLFGLVGILHGWYGLGKRAGAEAGTGIFLGVRSAVTVFIWLIFLLSLWQVIQDIIARRLVGSEPMVAIQELLNYAGEYLSLVANPALLGIFLGTGIFCGIVTRMAARRWD